MHRNVVKRSTIIVRVPVQIRKDLERLSDQEERSISAYVRIVLENHVKTHRRNKG